MASYAEHNQPAQRLNLNKGGNMVKNTTNQRPLHVTSLSLICSYIESRCCG